MANTLTNLTNTVLAQRTLESFTATLAPIMRLSNNFSDAAATRGDKIKVPFVSAQDAATNFSGTYSMQDADAEGLDIALDKHKFVSWQLTDKELFDMPQLSLERFARQKGFQLAKAVFQDILSVVTLANYGAAGFTGAASTFDADAAIDLSALCDEADFPENERALLLDASYHANLRKSLKLADGFGSDVIMRQGQIPSFDKFEAVMGSTVIPDNGENLTGMALHPDAILTAMRYLQPPQENTYSEAIPLTDPETGMTLGLRRWYDPDTGASRQVIEAVYGYRTGVTTGIQRIVSA